MLTIASVNESVLDLIGHTPLVDVSALSPNPDVRILAKLESQNPFGSVKDRIAKAMIEDAEKHGHLRPGQTIVEPSSGNTGIALAAIARIKGYPIKILLPENVSIERRQMLRGVRRRDHPHPRCRGIERSRARGPTRSPPSTPSGASSTSTATTPTRGRATRARARRSGRTAPRSPTSSPGWGRAAR